MGCSWAAAPPSAPPAGVSSRKWLLTSAESRVPGTGLGSGVLNAAFLVKGRVGAQDKRDHVWN